MKVRIGVTAALLALGALAGGCGGGGGSDEKRAEREATPRRAVVEIAAVRSALDDALTTYRSGDAEAAGERVGDAYLQHFELVEGPLERVDRELSERLEDTIRETLRERIRAGAPAAEVARLVQRIDARLDEAAAALQR